MEYGHPRNNRRSIQLHRAIAQKLMASPEPVLEKARRQAAVMQQDPRTKPYGDAWIHLLDLPLSLLVERMTENTEQMTDLRQCTPFAGVLTPQERWKIYRQFRAGEHRDA